MKQIVILFALLSLAACATNPYNDYYRANGTLHPELLSKQRTECVALGFKDGSTALAECRKDLAQDWKYNLEENRRDRHYRSNVGIGYGYGFGGRSGGSIGIGRGF